MRLIIESTKIYCYNLSMKNILLISSLFLLGLGALLYATSKRSDCFSKDFILTTENTAFLKPVPKQISKILSQPFTFIGSGNQAYAFESADHQYVLKLIKYHTTKQKSLIDYLPLYTWQQKRAEEREKKLHRIIDGFTLANSLDAKNCGIVYLQLNSSNAGVVPIRDKAGRLHQIDLGHALFVLQYKAIPAGKVLTQLIEEGNVKSALDNIAALFALIDSDLANGIYDADHNVMHNMGFYGRNPIRIDFGKLKIDNSMKDPLVRHQELQKIAEERIIPWVKKYHPTETKHVKDILAKYSHTTL